MADKPTGLSRVAAAIPVPKFRLIDAAMIILALVSVTLVVTDIFARSWIYDKGLFREVILIDLAITLIFVIDFIVENKGRSPLRMLRESWFDIVGLVPLIAFVWLEAYVNKQPFNLVFSEEVRLAGGAAATGGLIRLFRLVRIVRIVQAFSRFLRATNMTFGEQVAKGFFDKYRRIIVAELTTPIMVAGITVTQEIVVRMKFLESIGKAVDAKRPEIHAAIMESLEKNNVPQDILTKPIVDKVVKDVENAIVNALVTTLTGPELNKLTQEMIVDVMQNFKEQLQSPEGKAMLKNMGSTPSPAATSKDPAAKAFDGPSPL